MAHPRRVLIIGGGVAGPALGLFLQRAGIAASVFEAYPPAQGIGGGLALGPNGVRVLAALGLADQLAAHGSQVRDYWFRTLSGRTLARYGVAAPARYGQPMIATARASLAELLGQQLERQSVPIAYEKRLVGIQQDAAGVTAQLADGSAASGDLLIGADGVHSATRRLAVTDAVEPEFTGMVGVGGFVAASALPPIPLRDRGSMTFIFGANGFFGWSGAGNGQCMWWTNLPRPAPLSRAELSGTPTEVLRRELLDRFGGYCPPVPQLIAGSAGIIQLNVFDIRSLPSWHHGRVLVLGDAAHAVSPNAGQGASLALEDAMYLARLLRDVDDVGSAFSAFEAERKPRVERIVLEGRRRGADKQLVGPVQARIREAMLLVFLNLFGRNADDWVFRYQIDWPTPRPPRPQRRLKQPPLRSAAPLAASAWAIDPHPPSPPLPVSGSGGSRSSPPPPKMRAPFTPSPEDA